MNGARARAAKSVVIAVAFAAVALAGLGLQTRGARSSRAPQSSVAHVARVASSTAAFDTAVREAATRRTNAHLSADLAPDSWSRKAQVASAEMSYAQLTGDYDAYAAADRALAQAFAIARGALDDDASGPLLLKAQLDYELHRFGAALESLRVPEKQAEFFGNAKLAADMTSLRGALTFGVGRYEEGLALLRRSVQMDPSPAHAQRLAIALAKVGQVREAERIFEETEKATTAPRTRAWIAMQRGLAARARGDRGEARAQLERACATFPGYWQAEDHLAELDAEEGRTERAIAAYRSLVTRTGDPEFMDALAELVAERDPDEARRLRARANAVYEDRLELLPEASYGHALEHFLRMSPDTARAVDLAEKNRALRPDGEARTRLAQAYVRAGRWADARKEIVAVLDSPWISGESFATAAIVFEHFRDPRTQTMRNKAASIDPHAMRGIAWLTAH